MQHKTRTRSRSARSALALALGLSLVLVAPAAAAWNEPVGGASPINHNAGEPGFRPSLAAIDGVPYVAWMELDGTNSNYEIRVSRLNAAGDAWEEPVGGESPINHSSTERAEDPQLVGVAGVPYVAWLERRSARQREIRVARLDAAGTEWEQIGDGGPVNESGSAWSPAVAADGGVLYLAWSEDEEIRVRRLNTAGTGWEELASIPPAVSPVLRVRLAVVDGVPHVAWVESAGSDQQVRVSRLDAAGTAWEELPPAHSGELVGHVSLAGVAGVPHVAWTEEHATGARLRVKRLDPAAPGWDELGAGLEQASIAGAPSLTDVGGAPYLAWSDRAGEATQIRVSRLSGAEWEEVVGGTSPINHAPQAHANAPSLTAIGGVPYVAWSELGEGNLQIRVSRLEPDFIAEAAAAGQSEATLLAAVRTYGVAYPIAFHYGLGTGLDQQTAARRTAYDSDVDTVVQPLGGLTAGSEYSWRAVGFDGRRLTGAGPVRAFTTVPAPRGEPQREPSEQPVKLLVGVLQPRLTALTGRRVSVRYLSTAGAAVRLEVHRGGRLLATVPERATVGLNRIAWNGRVRGRRAAPGRYRLVIRAASADGQTASDSVSLRVTRRTVKRK
jgi:hypothetical protein